MPNLFFKNLEENMIGNLRQNFNIGEKIKFFKSNLAINLLCYKPQKWLSPIIWENGIFYSLHRFFCMQKFGNFFLSHAHFGLEGPQQLKNQKIPNTPPGFGSDLTPTYTDIDSEPPKKSVWFHQFLESNSSIEVVFCKKRGQILQL